MGSKNISTLKKMESFPICKATNIKITDVETTRPKDSKMRDEKLKSVRFSTNISTSQLISKAQIHKYVWGSIKLYTYVSPSLPLNMTDHNEGFGNTSHIFETDNGLLIIDAQFKNKHAQEVRKLANSLKKPIQAIIISHAHPDHYFGLASAFSDISSYALPEVIEKIKDTGISALVDAQSHFPGEVPDRIILPQGTIKPGLSNFMGLQLNFSKIMKAEADVQLLIQVPNISLMIVQDLIYSGYHPYIENINNVYSWILILQELKKYTGYDLILPGHGEPVTLKDSNSSNIYDEMIGYLIYILQLYNHGILKEQFKEYLIQRYPKLKGRELIDMYLPILFKQ